VGWGGGRGGGGGGGYLQLTPEVAASTCTASIFLHLRLVTSTLKLLKRRGECRRTGTHPAKGPYGLVVLQSSVESSNYAALLARSCSCLSRMRTTMRSASSFLIRFIAPPSSRDRQRFSLLYWSFPWCTHEYLYAAVHRRAA